MPAVTLPLFTPRKADQFTPVCAALLSCTSTILASSITWRSMVICTALRYSPT